MSQTQNQLKRYNLVLPEDMFNEVKKVADDRHTSVVEVIRRFIKLGLIVSELEEIPETGFFIKEGDTERQVILI